MQQQLTDFQERMQRIEIDELRDECQKENKTEHLYCNTTMTMSSFDSISTNCSQSAGCKGQHESELADELILAQECNSQLQSEIETLRESARLYKECIARAVEELDAAERSRESMRKHAYQSVRNANLVKEKALQKWKQTVAEKKEIEAKLSRVTFEQKKAEEKATAETFMREEMQKEMERLYVENIACGKELDDWKKGIIVRSDTNTEILRGVPVPIIGGRPDIAQLKSQIEALRDENASLRSTAMRDSEVIASLNDEINMTALSSVAAQEVAASSRKRALVLNKGSTGEDYGRNREFKRTIRYEKHGPHKDQIEQTHRERFNSAGGGSLELIYGPSGEKRGSESSVSLEPISSFSFEEQQPREQLVAYRSDTLGATVTTVNETDDLSFLFGQESVTGTQKHDYNAGDDTIKSDHDGIRAHAEKLLYWANRASERSSMKSDASLASWHQSSRPQSQQQPQWTSMSTNKYASVIPNIIGVPPCSQSRVRKSSLLPPRHHPPAASSSCAHEVSSDDDSTIVNDKENGGPDFHCHGEVPGAFPTVPRGIKTVSLSENDTIIDSLDCAEDDYALAVDTIIDHLDHADEDHAPTATCCECTASQFSGNNRRSEFYLPKLGLACNCSGHRSIAPNHDHTAFPEKLSNILRPWQCEFLSTMDITTPDALLRAHKADANNMARRMKQWRNRRDDMAAARSKDCYVALKIWSRTCKVVLRSLRERKERAEKRDDAADRSEDDAMVDEKPHYWDITFEDSHTIASISTLGQFSSVMGGRPLEMMEI